MTYRFVPTLTQQRHAPRVQNDVNMQSTQSMMNRPFGAARRLSLVAGTIALIGLNAHANQAEPRSEREAALERVVLDESLNATTVRVVSMSSSEFVGRTTEGKLLRLPTDKVLAILPAHPDELAALRRPVVSRSPFASSLAAAPEDGLLLLTDGQTLSGAPVRDFKTLDALQEAMPWQSRSLDRVVIPLERINVVVMRGSNIDWPVGTNNDVVILKNNDIAQGYVDTKYEPGDTDLSVLVEGEGGKVRRIPQRRISSIFLSNPAHPANGAWVWFNDGSTLRTTGVQFGLDMQGALNTTFTTPVMLGATSAATSDEPKAVEFEVGGILAYTPHRESLEPLVKVPNTVQATDSSRRWTAPPVLGDPVTSPLGAADIELPGPMSVTWTMPERAVRIAGVLELPESSRVWGDCNVTLTAQDGSKLFTTRLNGAAPIATFNVVLPTSKKSAITVRVDAGENGPIEDRVVIRRALILLDVKDPASAPSAKPAPAPRG